MEPSSLADWIAAGAGVATAMIALPTAYLLLKDRSAQNSRRIFATCRDTFRGALWVSLYFRTEDEAEALMATVRTISPKGAVVREEDVTAYDPRTGTSRVVETAPEGQRQLDIALSHHEARSTGLMRAEFKVEGPGGSISAAVLKVTVWASPSKTRLASRKIAISASS